MLKCFLGFNLYKIKIKPKSRKLLTVLQGASIVTIDCEGYTTVILVDDEQQTEITEKLRRKIYIKHLCVLTKYAKN